MSDHVAGVDAGGSSTRAAIADRRGQIVATAEGPAALADPRNPEDAASVIASVVRVAARRASVPVPVAALTAGVAGVGRESTRSAVEQALRRSGVAGIVRVHTDAEPAFFDAFGDGAGVLLVAGTGSIGWGRGERGDEARVGGWGALLGDEGSGYRIGLDALQCIVRAVDGRDPETSLAGAVLSALGLDRPEELVAWTARAAKADVAALVPVVHAQAESGDAVAARVLARAVEALEAHLLALLDTLSPWTAPPEIALSGGLIGPSGPLRPAVEAVLARHDVDRVEREPDPLVGAVALAARRIGRAMGGEAG